MSGYRFISWNTPNPYSVNKLLFFSSLRCIWPILFKVCARGGDYLQIGEGRFPFGLLGLGRKAR
jgi:hypothetical protein